jgi:hypothetical protein
MRPYDRRREVPQQCGDRNKPVANTQPVQVMQRRKPGDLPDQSFDHDRLRRLAAAISASSIGSYAGLSSARFSYDRSRFDVRERATQRGDTRQLC